MRLLQFIAATLLAVMSAIAPAYAEERPGMPLTAEQERGLKPKDTFRECDNCPDMVVVPAGMFTMGAPGNEPAGQEGPQHVVTISKPFAVGKLHVTVDQFAAFVRDTGYAVSSPCVTWPSKGDASWRNPGFAQDGTHPVVCMSWEDAKAYAEWLTKKTGKPYRLLSEAEFEYAARGQTSPGAYPHFWFGDDESVLCQYGNGRICGVGGTSSAGKYKPNTFSLYDMAGNAWQWTEDCWHITYAGAPADGSAWTSLGCGSNRVLRGGGWQNFPRLLHAAYRSRFHLPDTDIGFRVARTLSP